MAPWTAAAVEDTFLTVAGACGAHELVQRRDRGGDLRDFAGVGRRAGRPLFSRKSQGTPTECQTPPGIRHTPPGRPERSWTRRKGTKGRPAWPRRTFRHRKPQRRPRARLSRRPLRRLAVPERALSWRPGPSRSVRNTAGQRGERGRPARRRGLACRAWLLRWLGQRRRRKAVDRHARRQVEEEELERLELRRQRRARCTTPGMSPDRAPAGVQIAEDGLAAVLPFVVSPPSRLAGMPPTGVPNERYFVSFEATCGSRVVDPALRGRRYRRHALGHAVSAIWAAAVKAPTVASHGSTSCPSGRRVDVVDARCPVPPEFPSHVATPWKSAGAVLEPGVVEVGGEDLAALVEPVVQRLLRGRRCSVVVLRLGRVERVALARQKDDVVGLEIRLRVPYAVGLVARAIARRAAARQPRGSPPPTATSRRPFLPLVDIEPPARRAGASIPSDRGPCP